MKLLALAIAFWSTLSLAHEVQSVTQYLQLQRQNEEGWQQDLLGKITVNRKTEVGLQGTYLERFDLFEKRFGGLGIYKPNERLTLEAKLLFADEVEILPEKQFFLSIYYAMAEGLAPFITFRDTSYSVTHTQQMNLSMEIEKFTNILLIPQVMFGKATFNSPAQTRDIHNFGLKAIYYRERLYSFFVYAYKGTEASQGIIGQSNFIVDTLTGGLGASYHFIPQLKTELIIETTDYEQLKTQFVSTILNLVWTFQ